MSSTGEVGCIGEDYHDAVMKAMLSVGYRIPKKNILISSGNIKSKVDLLSTCQLLQANDFVIYATRGTQKFLEENGVKAIPVGWPDETDGTVNSLELIRNKEVHMVINIPKNLSSKELSNDYQIRRSAIDFNIPLVTNERLAKAFIEAFCKMTIDDISIKAWGEY